MKTYQTVLSIAGSDSVGGAGIQADIKTCCALGRYAMTVVTALTAQNTCGVEAVEPTSPAMLRAQLRAVLEDVRPDAVKIGMVPDGEAVAVIAEALAHYELPRVVVDPVMVSTSGHRLGGGDYVAQLKRRLIPRCTLLTPNLPEAEALSGRRADTSAAMHALALDLSREYGVAVLLKGGHLADTPVLTDVLATPDGTTVAFTHPHIDTPNTHGTGCSLSTAIACQLAGGLPLTEAVQKAGDWLHWAIAAGAEYQLGRGHGPIHHLYKNL